MNKNHCSKTLAIIQALGSLCMLYGFSNYFYKLNIGLMLVFDTVAIVLIYLAIQIFQRKNWAFWVSLFLCSILGAIVGTFFSILGIMFSKFFHPSSSQIFIHTLTSFLICLAIYLVLAFISKICDPIFKWLGKIFKNLLTTKEKVEPYSINSLKILAVIQGYIGLYFSISFFLFSFWGLRRGHVGGFHIFYCLAFALSAYLAYQMFRREKWAIQLSIILCPILYASLTTLFLTFSTINFLSHPALFLIYIIYLSFYLSCILLEEIISKISIYKLKILILAILSVLLTVFLYRLSSEFYASHKARVRAKEEKEINIKVKEYSHIVKQQLESDLSLEVELISPRVIRPTDILKLDAYVKNDSYEDIYFLLYLTENTPHPNWISGWTKATNPPMDWLPFNAELQKYSGEKWEKVKKDFGHGLYYGNFPSEYIPLDVKEFNSDKWYENYQKLSNVNIIKVEPGERIMLAKNVSPKMHFDNSGEYKINFNYQLKSLIGKPGDRVVLNGESYKLPDILKAYKIESKVEKRLEETIIDGSLKSEQIQFEVIKDPFKLEVNVKKSLLMHNKEKLSNLIDVSLKNTSLHSFKIASPCAYWEYSKGCSSKSRPKLRIQIKYDELNVPVYMKGSQDLRIEKRDYLMKPGEKISIFGEGSFSNNIDASVEYPQRGHVKSKFINNLIDEKFKIKVTFAQPSQYDSSTAAIESDWVEIEIEDEAKNVKLREINLSQQYDYDDWKSFVTEHFIIYRTKEHSASFIENTAIKLESNLKEITDNFQFKDEPNFTNDHRIRINIYDSEEEYRDEVKEINLWFEPGVIIKNENYFSILTFFKESNMRDWAAKRNNFYKNTLSHQLSHLLLNWRAGTDDNLPRWFQEGIALKWGDLNAVEQGNMKLNINEDSYVDLYYIEKAKQAGQAVAMDDLGVYAVSATKYLYSQLGNNRFQQLCSYLKEGYSFDEALNSASDGVYQDVIDFNDKWVDYIKIDGL